MKLNYVMMTLIYWLRYCICSCNW